MEEGKREYYKVFDRVGFVSFAIFCSNNGKEMAACTRVLRCVAPLVD